MLKYSCQPGCKVFGRLRKHFFLKLSAGARGSVNVLSGISSRPLSVEAMIATCFGIDHNRRVRDLVGVVEVVERLSEGGPWRCPAR